MLIGGELMVVCAEQSAVSLEIIIDTSCQPFRVF
jgi:hypothetical protein